MNINLFIPGFKLKYWQFAFVVALCISFTAKAQFASDYQFSAYSGTYTPLPALASPANLATPGAIQTAPLGFTFRFAGTDYTTVYACIHGWLSFNPDAEYSSQNNLMSGVQGAVGAVSRPLLAPLWDGLSVKDASARTAYFTSGIAGSQVFTLEWSNMSWASSLSVSVISFQVKLYEGTNKIEFIYRQEANPPQFASASIGIAGSPTGPGNYLSLNNTGPSPAVSYTTETNTLNTCPATGQVYAFMPPPVSPVDVRIISLAAPLANGCYGSSQTVKFTLKNQGNSPLNFAATPVTVNGVVRGPNALNLPPVQVSSGTLAPNATQDITVSTSYNMGAAGNYIFNARATVPGDGNTANDSLLFAVSRSVPPNVTLPQMLDFTGFVGNNIGTLYPGWYRANGFTRQGTGSRWSNFTGLGKPNNVTMSVDFPGVSEVQWVISPKFIPAIGTILRFKTAITAKNSINAAPTNMVGTDDEVKVMVSTDCGLTFNPILTFNSSNSATLTNVLTDQEVSLAPYAGQSIILTFYAYDGTVVNPGNYDFHVDDIFIGTPPPTDLGITAMVSPAASVCFGSSENVAVTVKNYGSSLLNFAATNATVQVNVSGPSPATLTATLNSGTFAPGASQNVTLSPPLNMQSAGTYNFKAFASIVGDGNHLNDTVTATREVGALAALPQTSGFTGFNGTNLSTVFPGWREASGPAPSGATSLWRGKTVAAVPGNVSLSIYMNTKFDEDWVISPKIMPAANTVIRFNAAITGFGSNLPTGYVGMVNTDNKVQVLVSTDCGNTFTPIYTFDASNTSNLSNRWTPYSFPLSQFAGQAILVAIYATDGVNSNTNKFDFDIDDLFIGTPPPADLGVTALVTPTTTGCYTNAETVSVTVKNFNANPIDFSASNALVTVKVTGAATATLTGVLNSGILAPGASYNLILSPTINMLPAGGYNFKAYTTIAGDNQAFNDTATTSRIRYQLVTTSPNVDFTGYTGTNLSAVFPDWREAYGNPPGSATGQTWGAKTGLGTATNVTADLYLHDTWQNNWLIGPKFTATANSQLVFDAAITDWPNLTPDPTGMAGTDDTVQVMVSTDCGATYNPIYTFDATTAAGLGNSLTQFTIPLGTYAGQQIAVAFYGSGGTINDASEYGFHLDNIAISNLTSISGMNKDDKANAITVFPNPNKGSFEVKLGSFAKDATLTLSSLTGQEIKALRIENAASGSVKFNVQDLAPGIYLLRVTTVEKVSVKKIMIH